jgi:hypothetical protein
VGLSGWAWPGVAAAGCGFCRPGPRNGWSADRAETRNEHARASHTCLASFILPFFLLLGCCRRELHEIEASAVAFQVATEEATAWEFDGVSGSVCWMCGKPSAVGRCQRRQVFTAPAACIRGACASETAMLSICMSRKKKSANFWQCSSDCAPAALTFPSSHAALPAPPFFSRFLPGLQAIQELEAKFQFLRGIYRAHSKGGWVGGWLRI